MGYVAAGAIAVVNLNFTVLSGSQTPAEGTLITPLISDRANGAMVSESVKVQ
jgi:hypothetical protein